MDIQEKVDDIKGRGAAMVSEARELVREARRFAQGSLRYHDHVFQWNAETAAAQVTAKVREASDVPNGIENRELALSEAAKHLEECREWATQQ
ncbi:MAG: hypothetical protein OXE17_00805 [Chloroflexi bacterium]|nr:hypothetical protein [Chloroflexota bacterium]